MKAIKTAAFFLMIVIKCFAQDFWMQLDVPENFIGRSIDANYP